MGYSILQENQKKRIELPLWLLVCFSMFNVWQMGFIYFMGPSLVLDGRTPLPINMDNVTMLIAVGYVLSILLLIFLPQLVVWSARVTTVATLVSVLGLFLPLSAEVLTLLLYLQTFFCCFMIGFETFIISNLFSEKSTINHLTVAYSVSLVIIAVVQNDLFPVSFPVFRASTLVMLVMMLVFFFRLPAQKEALPRYARKGDDLRCPLKLFAGIFLYSFVANMMTLGGPTAAAEVPNGIFLAYFADAVAALVLYLLYRKANIHPLHVVSVFMGLSVVGFLFLYISAFVPSLAYPACVLIGFGFVPCQMMPLFGLTMIKSYPSKFIAPGIIGMALLTVLVQSGLVEAFRSAPDMLNLAYLAITVVGIVIYWHLAPFVVHIFQEKKPLIPKKPQQKDTEISDTQLYEFKEAEQADPLLQQLTVRELEVLNLIGGGYSNKEIAGIMYISEHTVNDYTKKIYRKLEVHSRHAAAQIINRHNLFTV